MYRLLLVDDDPMLADLVSHVLGKDYRITPAASLGEAYKLVEADAEVYDLVLLDVSLPDGEGYLLCARLKEIERYRNIPVLFLTGHAQISDKVLGFTVGADDYITKPCSIEELRMRIKARLKGGAVAAAVPDGQLRKGGLRVDLESGEAFLALEEKGEHSLGLTPLELQLLAHFMKNEDRVFTRTQLSKTVWGETSEVDQDVVESHVAQLRAKLVESSYTIAGVFDGAGFKFTLLQKR